MAQSRSKAIKPFSRRKILKKQEDRQTLDEMSHLIPGLSIVMDHHESTLHRIAWAIILTASLATCSLQVSNFIKAYLNAATTFKSKVTVNDTVSLPTFTICAEKVYVSYEKKLDYAKHQNQTEVCQVSWSDIVGFQGQDVHQVWNSYQTGSLINITEFPEAQVILPSVVQRKPTATFLGMCENLDLSENIIKYEFGRITYFKITFTEPRNQCDYKAIKLLVHSPEDNVKHLMLRQSLEIPIGYEVDLMITSYKKVIFMNKKSSPCLSKREYLQCINTCLDNLLLNGSKCRLPFMEVDLPNCRDSQSALNAYKMAERVYNSNPRCPQCAKRCIEDKYKSLVSIWSTRLKGIDMYIYFKDNMYQTATEVPVYEFVTLVSDIGGSVGDRMGNAGSINRPSALFTLANATYVRPTENSRVPKSTSHCDALRFMDKHGIRQSQRERFPRKDNTISPEVHSVR